MIQNKICLISTYCDTEEKQRILFENIKKIKTVGLDVMIFTPTKLPYEIYDLCDYVIKSKENHVFDWPKKAYSFWFKGEIKGKYTELYTSAPDHGFANLIQFKRMGDLSIDMGYNHFFYMIYDIEIDDDIINIITNSTQSSLYKSIRGDKIWNMGLHFVSLDQERLKIFNDHITEEIYLEDLDGDAFSWLERIFPKLQIEISNKMIKDQIYLNEGRDLFDNSPFPEMKCFIHKNDYDDLIKMYFHGFNGSETFKIKVDDMFKKYEVEEWDEIVISNQNFNICTVENKGRVIDMSNIIKNIKDNILQRND